jgi:hypothetical protein
VQPVYMSTKPGEPGYSTNLVLSKMLIPTLVVGGDPSFVSRKIAPRLFRHGLHMVAHWPYKKANGTFPANAEVLVVLTDMIGHSMSDAAVTEATKRGLPVIYGVRKYAVLEQRLRDGGYPEIPTLAPKPLDASTTHAEAHAYPTHVRPLLVPSPEAAAPFIAEALPMPVSAAPAPAPVPAPEVIGPDLLRALKILAKAPGISNRALEANGFSKGTAWALAQKGRTLLGIHTHAGNQTAVRIERETFTATCAQYGLESAEIPADGLFPKENRPMNAPPAPAPSPALVIATIPTAEVPPEVLAEAPSRVVAPVDEPVAAFEAHASLPPIPAPRSAPADVKELVQLLRLAMAAENIERLTITKEGLSFRRIVVEEGEYDV